jgi:hypothetical protein
MLSVVFNLLLCGVLCLIYCYAECLYADCHYADCRYAECPYAKCRGAWSGTHT